VSVSPTAPGSQRPGASSAARLANAAVQLSDGQGHVVAQAASNEEGQFTSRTPHEDGYRGMLACSRFGPGSEVGV
jgi:hypothetical protein